MSRPLRINCGARQKNDAPRNKFTFWREFWCSRQEQPNEHLHAAFVTNPEHVKQASTWRAWMSVANSNEINPSSDSRLLNRHIKNLLWRRREGCKYICWKNAKDLKPRIHLHFTWDTSIERDNSNQKLSKWILHRWILLSRKQEFWFKMTKLRSKCNNPFRNLQVYWHVLYVTRYGTRSRAYNVSTCECAVLQINRKLVEEVSGAAVCIGINWGVANRDEQNLVVALFEIFRF